MNIVQALLAIAILGSSWVLWLLILLSFVSVGVMIDRVIFFRRFEIKFSEFLDTLTQLLVDNKIEEAEKFCAENHAPEAQVASRALQKKDKGPQAMDKIMGSYLVNKRQQFERGLIVLGTLGNNAPFIGLFGTVIGIIQAFHSLSVNPAGGPTVVMAGISEALIATAVGLVVAIPAVVAFNIFQRMVKRRMANAETVRDLVMSHFLGVQEIVMKGTYYGRRGS